MSDTDLFIADNSIFDNSVKKYLSEWCDVSKQMDIATGYFEIGSLLELDGKWQKLDKIRILFGDEVTKRTKNMFEMVDQRVNTFLKRLDDSIEKEKDIDEFLVGVPAIVKAIKDGKIECRVYNKGKFHAKSYITYFKDDFHKQFLPSMNIHAGYALVGSSNFTKAGLTQNIELNVQIPNDVEKLQKWFNEHWEEAEDVTPELLKTIEIHVKEYSPFDVYLKSMYEYFKEHDQTIYEWEEHTSKIYPELSQYQKDGYNSLINIANNYSGAFLCDGVGLGKTFVGMMLIERFVKKERKNVVLIVPASTRDSVWETAIKKYVPDILEGFSPFKIINHTDLLSDSKNNLLEQIAKQAEIVIIDEAHHFRNQASGRYRKLFEMMNCGNKQMFMLTATPINNSFYDLQHLIELFTHGTKDYFKSIGVHTLQGYFRTLEAQLNSISDASDFEDESNDIFRNDKLINQLVVQRSRAYVVESLNASEGACNVVFPNRQDPTVANYSLKLSYGELINDFIKSFDKVDKNGKRQPIITLPIYSPFDEPYFIGDKSKIDEMKSGRQAQVVNLIRQLLLKRFESSLSAFEETCIRIYVRLLNFLEIYKKEGNVRNIERYLQKHEDTIEYVKEKIRELNTFSDYENDLPKYVWDEDENLTIDDFDIRIMLEDTMMDLDVISDFIEDIQKVDSTNDDKIRELKHILADDSRVKGKKVIIFSEYRATAKYIFDELNKAGFSNIYEIDGQSKVDRHEIVQRFSPYYNDLSSIEVEDEISILIATDILSEGLNLQDASCLINYDLHWNPVRLMQRIGRVDRRRNIEIEKKLLADHPELEKDRDNIYYWNFLPPDELDSLLSLYEVVSQKTLRISKTFGIEGKKLLTADDDYEALKNFNSKYEGQTSSTEDMILAYQKLMSENPDYSETVKSLPKKMFSGKVKSGQKGIFFCYELPVKSTSDGCWSENGVFRWYFINSDTNEVSEQAYEIWQLIKCSVSEPRIIGVNRESFSVMKESVYKHIRKEYLRQINADMHAPKPRLVTWMELY